MGHLESRRSSSRRALLAAGVLLAMGGSAGNAAVNPAGGTVEHAAAVYREVRSFELPAPAEENDKRYLGLSGEGKFTPAQVDAKILLVEVFSFYCPHCQRAAEKVNELFKKMREGAATKGRVKIIGIGASNSAYEVKLFKEKYQVEFPLFSDEELEVTRLLDVKFTPTFIGIKVHGDGRLERVYFREDGSWDAEELLAELVRASETEKENKQ